MSELLIKLTWDPDTCVWIAESDDVPGLVLESGSFDALIERVRFAVPELLELNGTAPAPDHDIWYSPISERHFTVDGKIKSRHTANAIMKQSGIDRRFR